VAGEGRKVVYGENKIMRKETGADDKRWAEGCTQKRKGKKK
jgi:hypothetical protein